MEMEDYMAIGDLKDHLDQRLNSTDEKIDIRTRAIEKRLDDTKDELKEDIGELKDDNRLQWKTHLRTREDVVRLTTEVDGLKSGTPGSGSGLSRRLNGRMGLDGWMKIGVVLGVIVSGVIYGLHLGGIL